MFHTCVTMILTVFCPCYENDDDDLYLINLGLGHVIYCVCSEV